MKKSMIIAGAMMVLGASIASAQGEINLRWTECDNANNTVIFACNSNTVVGSFVAPALLPEFLGISAVMSIHSVGSAEVPNWWQHGVGLCRGTTGLATNFDFTAANGSCLDFYSGQAAGGFAYEVGVDAPNQSRLRIQCAVPFENRGPVSHEDGEYYAFKVVLLRSKTVGPGACQGCHEATCMTLNEIQLFQPPEQNNDPRITTPGPTQGMAGFQFGCFGDLPVKTATWGQVKSLYR